MATITCKRCEGKGRLAHFGHVNNGVCLSCRGSGKVLKTKRVTTLETCYTVVAFNGTRVHCGTDKAKAEALHVEWIAMNCHGHIESREVKKTTHVPV